MNCRVEKSLYLQNTACAAAFKYSLPIGLLSCLETVFPTDPQGLSSISFHRTVILPCATGFACAVAINSVQIESVSVVLCINVRISK